jgi:hypothetical protein
MPGLVPGIHVLSAAKEDVDGRDKRGHDDSVLRRLSSDLCLREPSVAMLVFLA